ncbi:MAG: PrsW family intramembrane metalloprotease [Bacilli bacterium]|nr:PrsW family intramembrane metalloprotease [Bacilli bacterium]
MAYTGILLILAVLPVLAIMLYVYHKDGNKEPMKLLIRLFLSGILSCFVVLTISRIMEMFLPFMNSTETFLDVLLYAFIGVAFIEELCKWFMTYIVAYHQRDFDEMYDGIVYSIFVSLGFAFFENIVYVIRTSSINTALIRAVSAVPSHACDAIFMGYYLSVAKQYSIRKEKELEKKNIILSLVIPIVLHGIYDFCLMSGQSIFITVFIVFIIFLYLASIKKLKRLSNRNKKIRFKNKFCHVCGKAITGEYCAKCGTKQI